MADPDWLHDADAEARLAEHETDEQTFERKVALYARECVKRAGYAPGLGPTFGWLK